MAVTDSCDIANKENEVKDPLMEEKSVNDEAEERKKSKSKRKRIVLFCVFLAAMTVAVVVAYFTFKATSSTPDVRRRCIQGLGVLNGKLTNVTGIHEGDTADVDCHDGHRVNGSSTVSCLPSGHWNETPVCLPLPCGKLLLPEHTKLDLRHLKHRINEVNIACDIGYVLEGDKNVFCQTDGLWSEVPKCKPVDCGMPAHTANAIYTNFTLSKYNDTIGVKCAEGYVLNGKDVLRCQSDGKWEGLPECNRISCGAPIMPQHSLVYNIEGFSFEDSITYKCESGYVLIGRSSILCKSNGMWSVYPECKKPCLKDINITNGRVIKHNVTHSKDMWLEGDIVRIECLSGYKLNGSHMSECLPSGEWSERQSCVRKQCAAFETPNNAEITSAKQLHYYVNDEVTISCLEGFRLNGSASVTCLEVEEWSAIPFCVPIVCPVPIFSNDVLIHKFTGIHYNSIFYVTCRHGFILKGESTLRCGSDGKWVGRPTCQLVSCGHATARANAYFLTSNCMHFECEITVGCRQGYDLAGNNKATCQADGQWSSHYECVQIKEKPPSKSGGPGISRDDRSHNGKSGGPGIHRDGRTGAMVLLFVVTFVIQAFSS